MTIHSDPRIKDPMIRLRVELLIRGWDVAELAKAAGYTTESLFNQYSKSFESPSARLAVEYALNLPIWTSPAEFEMRRHVLITFARGDAFRKSRATLKKIARQHDITLGCAPSKKNLVLTIAAEIARRRMAQSNHALKEWKSKMQAEIESASSPDEAQLVRLALSQFEK